jgi:hypothetical protein
VGETEFRLAPPRQVRVGGVSIGFLSIRPGAEHRQALVGMCDPDTPGDDRHLNLVVSWPGGAP